MDRILDMATALIADKGSEHLKMSELAERAGISIGSLYQYFPDKQAVIRTLAEAILRAIPRADPKKTATTAFLVWQLGEATMRLAIAHPRNEGLALVEVYKKMGLRAIGEPG